MRQTARAAAHAATIAASLWTTIAQASLMPIDKFVDLIEAVYSGPVATGAPSPQA
jgi:hypothetical protein